MSEPWSRMPKETLLSFDFLFELSLFFPTSPLDWHDIRVFLSFIIIFYLQYKHFIYSHRWFPWASGPPTPPGPTTTSSAQRPSLSFQLQQGERVALVQGVFHV